MPHNSSRETREPDVDVAGRGIEIMKPARAKKTVETKRQNLNLVRLFVC